MFHRSQHADTAKGQLSQVREARGGHEEDWKKERGVVLLSFFFFFFIKDFSNCSALGRVNQMVFFSKACPTQHHNRVGQNDVVWSLQWEIINSE